MKEINLSGIFDLEGRQVIFWRTKNGKKRVADLPPKVAQLLRADTGMRTGRVFLTAQGKPYSDKTRNVGAGGQIKTAFASAVRRAGLGGAKRRRQMQGTRRITWANRDLKAMALSSIAVSLRRIADCLEANRGEAA